MNENEVIIVNGIPAEDYDNLILDCVKYSIISLPFTVDRMSIPDETRRALNIAKGKIAEKLFQYFCKKNKIKPDFEVCSTPFWTVDRRDFLLNNCEWDIKNNFIYHSNNILTGLKYTDLPVLVPNRFNGDQWSKRMSKEFQNSRDVCFLFTFLKSASLNNGQRGAEFLEILLSDDQKSFLRQQYALFKGHPHSSQPFTPEWFWSEMSKRGDLTFYNLNFRPSLIITSYANSNHWSLFRNTGPYDRDNNFQTYLSPRWYQKFNSGSISFMSNTLWTKITNSTLPVSSLPSFLSLYPELRIRINCAEIIK
jgi:hypothetical protein